jgi:hypothetical protein
MPWTPLKFLVHLRIWRTTPSGLTHMSHARNQEEKLIHMPSNNTHTHSYQEGCQTLMIWMRILLFWTRSLPRASLVLCDSTTRIRPSERKVQKADVTLASPCRYPDTDSRCSLIPRSPSEVVPPHRWVSPNPIHPLLHLHLHRKVFPKPRRPLTHINQKPGIPEQCST